MAMTATLERFLSESPLMALAVAFWAGVLASLNSYTLLRLPVIAGCTAGLGTLKKQSLAVATVFTLGLVASYVVLGAMIAFGNISIEEILRLNKYVYWLFGGGLLLAGIWVGGFLGSGIHHDPNNHEVKSLGRATLAGLFFLGIACGLPLIPVGSSSGIGLLVLARCVAGHGLSWMGLLAFLSFGMGQSVPVLAVGLLTALVKTPLIRRLRPKLCSIEQQIRLAAGNGLMVLGIYFMIVG
jgi:cytochrome c biogenesis protein CcdA